MSRKNPTSPLRAGFDYQDSWGLYLCAQWLCNPKNFKWIKFETVPDEVADRAFYLDDIVLCGQDDKYHFYQIKHTQDTARDYWSWDTLLEQDKRTTGNLKDSLIQKWYCSYSKPELKGKVDYAALVTNGIASDDIRKCLFEGLIDIEKVKTESHDAYSIIKEQLVDEDKLLDFYSHFKFLFGQKDIDDLEDEARKCLYERLKVTKKGVTNLIAWIHKECRKQYTTRLNLQQVREWCEFDIPRPLNESYYVPEDFELFDKSLHEKIIADFQNKEGGVKVLYGKPGSGKSTYISRLNQILASSGTISIRHHYYISANDLNPMERLSVARVEEAIKAQFKEHSEELEEVAYENSANVPLQKFISQLAAYFYKKEKSFVLFVDGLDYVLRYAGASELQRLIREVCFPQPGLWIVFGTQEVAKDYLPQIVFDKCPKENWIEIKGLDRDAVSNIIRKNLIGLNVPQDKSRANEVNDKIFALTQGNPLHLRYTLSQLKIASGNKLVTAFECNNLLPYGGDISQYYDSLWRTLSNSGKTIAQIISSVDFRFSENQLFDLLSTIEQNPSKISEGYNSIAHLVSPSRKGIAVYHNSFESFILAQPEFQQQNKSIKARIKDWLDKSTYDELKWAELNKINYDLGNPEPLLELGKDWLIDAMCYPREPHKVNSQLETGAKAAFENKRFGKVFELASLHAYYRNAVEYVEEYERVWEEAFNASERNPGDFDLSRLSSRQIKAIVQKADRLGVSELIDEALGIFRANHKDLRITPRGEIGGEIPQLPSNLIKVVSLGNQHQVKPVHSYIKQFEKSGWAEDLFGIYTDALLNANRFLKVQELLQLELTLDEKRVVLDRCAEYDLRCGERHFLGIIAQQDHKFLTYFSLMYLLIKGEQNKFIPPLPEYKLFPDKVPEYETGKRNERAKTFSENFILGIIYGLTGREKDVQGWIGGIEPRWALEIMSQLFNSSLTLSKQIKESKTLSFTDVFINLSHVIPLRWPERRDLYELQLCLRWALSSILRLIYSLKYSLAQKVELNTDDMEKMVSGAYFNQEELLQFLLSFEVPILTNKTYELLMSKERTKWEKLVSNFPERTGHYADLAKLAHIHKDDTNRRTLLELAANNLLGYGYHKDMYLNNVLQSIEICHRNGSSKTSDWIKRMSPIVENVTEYTDGDETHYFTRDLADVLSKIDRNLLYKYYYQKAHDEDLFLAQDIFKYVLDSLHFNKQEDVALSATALDASSFGELKSLSNSHEGAAQALNNLEDYFGHIEFLEEERSTDALHSAKEAVDYSAINPQQLEKHLESFTTRWDERDFLLPWSKHWLDKGEPVNKEAYQALVKLVERDGLSNAESELLDIIYPLAYQYDNTKAFEFLCRAQANDNGWELYWTDKRKAEKRWDFVSRYYANRYAEFFEKSIFYSGIKYGRGGKYFIPVPRGIEFLALFGELNKMEEITESSVKFAESLMADVELPLSTWINLLNVDELDILLQRLVWPSPLVRERAATALAGLLKFSLNKEIVLGKLLNWICKQELESTVAIGLLPLLKAAEMKDNAVDYIDTRKLTSSLPFTSVVIEKLLEKLSLLLNTPIDFKINRRSINVAPAPYTVNEFFDKHISSFLAPIYLSRAEIIEKNTLRNFKRQWAYTAEEMMRSIGLKEDAEVLDFLGDHNSPSLAGMSTTLSEVYRSAFLRALQYYRDQGLIPVDVYLKYAYATLPIELSYWKVKPTRAPAWWPKLKRSQEKTDKSSLHQISFEKGIDPLVNSRNAFKVLGLDGTVEPGEGWNDRNILNTSITLVAFGYKITGPNIPEPKEVANEILYSPTVTLKPETTSPFTFLEAYDDHIAIDGSPVNIADLVVYPLITRNNDLVIALWQWFRDYSIPFGLYNGLRDDSVIEIESETWNYVKDGCTIAKSSSWLEGLKERNDRDMGIPGGNYIEINSSTLESYLKMKGLRIGYVLKTTFRYKEYSYQDVKTFNDYKLFRVNPIIF